MLIITFIFLITNFQKTPFWTILVCMTTVVPTYNADVPKVGGTYAIRTANFSGGVGGYLAPLGTGWICLELSPTSPIPNSAPFAEEFMWTIKEWNGGVILENENRRETHLINDITYDKDYPPFCKVVYNTLKFLPSGRNDDESYIIKRPRQDECLSFRWGSGRTVWEPCGGDLQGWIFESV